MAVLGRVHAAFAASLRSLRYSDKGVTAVEYGVLVALLGVAMLGAVAGLYSAATASYNRSEGEVGNLGTSCVGDEVIDPVSGLCSDNPLSISGVTPAYGPPAGGTTVTITVIFTKSGYTLNANPTVTFDGNPATVVSSTPVTGGGTIVVTSPLGTLGPANVVVNNPGTIATTDTAFSAFTYATVPGAPGTPVATAGDTSASVSWAAPTDFGGLPLSDYEVQYRVGAGAWTNFVDAGGATTTTTVTGLTNGLNYQFQVRAVNAVGPGAWSDPSLPVTPAATGPVAPTAPTAPTITSIVGGNQLLTVNFNAPSSNGGALITNYEYTTDGSTWTPLSPASVSSPLVITGLADSTSYTVQIRAVNSVGPGAESLAAVGTTSGPVTTVPSAPQAPTGVAGNGQVDVTWVAPADGGSPIDVYDLQYSTSASGPWTSFSNSLAGLTGTVSPLTNGTPYFFRVLAHNANGWSLPSAASASVTPATVPGAPTNVVGTAGNAEVSLTWTAPSTGGSAITDYEVQYRIGSGSWSTFTDGVGTATAATVTSLTNGSAYTFQVRARNAVDWGPWSTTSSSVTPIVATAPDAPTNVTAVSPSSGRITLSWTASVDNGSAILRYRLARATVSSNSVCSAASFGNEVTTTNTTYPFTGLNSTSWYCFRVRAENAIGNSSYVYVGPVYGQLTDPGDPRNVAATSTVSGQILVTWDPPLSDGGGAIEYRVRIAPATSTTNCSTANLTWSSDYTTELEFLETGLTATTWYCVRVRTYNVADNNLNSNYVYYGPLRASPATAPDAVTDLSGTRGNQSVTLAWTAPSANGSPINGYLVERRIGSGGSWVVLASNTGSTSTSYLSTGLTNGTTYYYRVAAINGVGTGPYSNVTTALVPKAPYSGSTPNNRYPATGETDVTQGTTYSLSTLYSIADIVYDGSSCVGGAGTSGCGRSSFNTATGVFTFNGNFGSRTANYTIDWSIPETSSVEGTSGSFTIYFD